MRNCRLLTRSEVAKPLAEARSNRCSRLTLRELHRTPLRQLAGLVSLFTKTSLAASITSCAHCRSRPISYCVSIRGAGEVPSLRLSKAIEGVTEVFAPPLLEVVAVFLFELMDLVLRRVQLRRVGLPSKRERANDPVATLRQPGSQLGECSTLSDKVVHHVFSKEMSLNEEAVCS